MANLNNFNANDVEPAVGLEPIPSGKYLVFIFESQLKTTKMGTGKFLELTFEVLEGPFKGRRLWTRLNLQNPSSAAVAIARAELSAICRAVGVMTPTDSVELHNIPLIVTVGQKKRLDTGEPTNVIKDYAKKEMKTPPDMVSGNSGWKPPWQK